MNYYQEITIIDQDEVSCHFIWSKLYMQLHLAFVEHQTNEKQSAFGVSFPQYHCDANKMTLGKKLRIFSQTQEELTQLSLNQWLNRLLDYVHITRIRETPLPIEKYAIYQRVQSQQNAENLARRYAKRNALSYEQALTLFANVKNKNIQLPYIYLQSLTTHQRFKLFIQQKIIEKSENANGSAKFTCYGLSSTAAVPIF